MSSSKKASRPGSPSQVKNKKQKAKSAQDWKTTALRVLALLSVVGISVFVFQIRDRVQDFAAFGYPGIFLIALLTNATVFLPAPGVAVVFAMGAVFHPLGVGFSAGAGGALGELSGYLAGFSGQAVVEKVSIYQRIHPWIERYGPFAILILAAIPNPVFDLAGVAAGAVKMPLWQFLLCCWIGQTIKMTAFAYSGAYSLTWLSGFLQQ